jgi:AcrR family transcriptional regulator
MTRKAILASARRAFVRAGYDGVGVREIAAGAGVTATRRGSRWRRITASPTGYSADDIRAALLDDRPTVALAIFPPEKYTGTITTDLFGRGRNVLLWWCRAVLRPAKGSGRGIEEAPRGQRLVNRYFGSKEKLFAEVVAETMMTPAILTQKVTRSPTLGEDLATAIIDQTRVDANPLDGFVIMLLSASNKRAAEIWREQVEAHHQKVMTEALSGDLAAERAAMVLALIAGFQFMRQMIGLHALVEADPMTLRKILAPLFQQLVAGEWANGESALQRKERRQNMIDHIILTVSDFKRSVAF